LPRLRSRQRPERRREVIGSGQEPTLAAVKAILLLLAALAVPAVSAQDDRLRTYRVAVILYQGKQADAALRNAGSWKLEAVRRDARQLIEDPDTRLAPGVALLMTELARRDTRAGGPERFAVAEARVSNLRRNSPDIRAFQERWYAFMTSVFIAELNPAGARTVIDRGLRVVGESSRLQLLSGIAYEMSTYPHATCLASDCRLSDDQRARNLSLVANAYRRASALDPHSPDAHLRLGRVLHLAGDRDGARQELAEVERGTSRVELLYLVALFRADLNQQAGDVRGASAEAERAVNLGPEYQSARIALAHLSDQLGMADRSRKIVDELLQLRTVGDPWWEFRQPAEDFDSLEWLNAYIRQ
jgi:tetratricopeptide (TPR) repeat protein